CCRGDVGGGAGGGVREAVVGRIGACEGECFGDGLAIADILVTEVARLGEGNRVAPEDGTTQGATSDRGDRRPVVGPVGGGRGAADRQCCRGDVGGGAGGGVREAVVGRIGACEGERFGDGLAIADILVTEVARLGEGNRVAPEDGTTQGATSDRGDRRPVVGPVGGGRRAADRQCCRGDVGGGAGGGVREAVVGRIGACEGERFADGLAVADILVTEVAGLGEANRVAPEDGTTQGTSA